MSTPTLATPLSDDEFEELRALLDESSEFDTHGVLGILHAVAVSPGVIRPPTWLSIALPSNVEDRDPASMGRLLDLLLRLHTEVLEAVRDKAPIVPPPEEHKACASFASGYASAAALDPLWLDDADRWTFASCFAYLADLRELVPAHTQAEMDALPDSKDTTRRHLAALINSSQESFRKHRLESLSLAHHNRPPARAVRVGRNDPCPCGSGKKYKRCCIDRPITPSSR